MPSNISHIKLSSPPNALMARYQAIRGRTMELCRTLEPEDYVVQTMPSASPTKWHLAHTSWFFEQFILRKQRPNYVVYNDSYHFLFNSYYYTVGPMYARPERGLLSRPTVKEITAYRDYVDEHMLELIGRDDAPWLQRLVELGLNHEQQHQELILTDIKHVFAANPLQPQLLEANFTGRSSELPPMTWQRFVGGIQEIGARGNGFHFDNETPRHRAWLADFEIADRLVTNRDYDVFIADGGYRSPELWLADGWAWLNQGQIDRPLYWSEDRQSLFTLSGRRDIDPDAPVCHLSFYEADAFARWAGARLPSEAEWEVAAQVPVAGNLLDSGMLHPQPVADDAPAGLQQIFGDVWEWTASSYGPYPGFEPLDGSLGEYNGKFMCNQMVCRGGSCVTPADHIRASYRNFFYPHERWQFFGLRLARNAPAG